MTITRAGKKLLKELGINPKAKSNFKLRKWSELYPNGRYIYYEGDDPQGFIEEMKAKFGFDPSKDNPDWGEEYNEDGEQWKSYGFFCPVEHLDEIYSGTYPMGS
mgnify:CR=1 FL=1